MTSSTIALRLDRPPAIGRAVRHDVTLGTWSCRPAIGTQIPFGPMSTAAHANGMKYGRPPRMRM